MKKINIEDFDWCKNCTLVNKYNELIDINNEHQKLNGELREENKQLKEQLRKIKDIVYCCSQNNYFYKYNDRYLKSELIEQLQECLEEDKKYE